MFCQESNLPKTQKTLQLLRTVFYDNRYDFKFSILRFPFIGINIPIVPAYGVYISQLIRYSRVVDSYLEFLYWGQLLIRKLLNQGFLVVKFKSSLRKCYSHHHDLVNCSRKSVSKRITDMFRLT